MIGDPSLLKPMKWVLNLKLNRQVDSLDIFYNTSIIIQTVVKENEIKCTLSQIVVGSRADIFNQRIPINVGRINKIQ